MMKQLLIGFTITILIIALSLYLFNQYLLWAADFNTRAQFDSDLRASYYSYFIPPQSVIDSQKYISFWITYYRLYYGI